MNELPLAHLIGALSYALDITEGQPPGHCVRCCLIGMRIGRAIGLPEESLWELYYTLLLKDVGCSSNAARICELYLTDDIAFKRDFKWVDGDIFDAITAKRPYRDAVPIDKTLAIMAETVGSALDPGCFDALERVVRVLEADKSTLPPRAA